MAAKKLSPQQARDRRAKIMLAVLGVVFVGVLALELPKVMGGSGGGGATAAAPTTTTSATATTPAAPALASSTSQLTHFSRFAAKDPFRAQAVAKASDGGAAPVPPAPKPAKPKKPAAPPLTISVTQAAPPTGPRVPAALLLINGKKRVVALNAGFPAKQPVFRVVALSQNAIWIQLVGGSLSNGDQTIKIEKGRHVTLANTTVGLKLALALLKPTTAPAPPPASTTTAATQTTPAAPTTTSTPTTTTTG